MTLSLLHDRSCRCDEVGVDPIVIALDTKRRRRATSTKDANRQSLVLAILKNRAKAHGSAWVINRRCKRSDHPEAVALLVVVDRSDLIAKVKRSSL